MPRVSLICHLLPLFKPLSHFFVAKELHFLRYVAFMISDDEIVHDSHPRVAKGKMNVFRNF